MLYSLCLLSTHASNFNAGIVEFDAHRQLGQLPCLSVGYDMVKHTKYCC